MIEILGRNTSVNVQIVMWAVSELGLTHKRHDIGGAFGGNDSQDYLLINPNGLVPVMKDGDLSMFESAAIVRYLSHQYGDQSFYPRDPKKRAMGDMWAEWIKTTFSPLLLMNIFYPLVRFDPALLDQKALDQASVEMEKLAIMLDNALGQGPWIAGDNMTHADILIGSMLYRYYELDFNRANTPNIDAYYSRLKAREAYQENVMVSFDSLRWKPS